MEAQPYPVTALRALGRGDQTRGPQRSHVPGTHVQWFVASGSWLGTGWKPALFTSRCRALGPHPIKAQPGQSLPYGWLGTPPPMGQLFPKRGAACPRASRHLQPGVGHPYPNSHSCRVLPSCTSQGVSPGEGISHFSPSAAVQRGLASPRQALPPAAMPSSRPA